MQSINIHLCVVQELKVELAWASVFIDARQCQQQKKLANPNILEDQLETLARPDIGSRPHHCIRDSALHRLFCTAKATRPHCSATPHALLCRARTRASCTVRHLAAAADTVTVSVHEAQSTTAQALRMIGWDDEAADVQAEIMTAAELCGNNQGLVKMFNPSLMAPQPGAGKPVVERETATSAAINANQAPGMLAAVTASDLAADKALENNVAVVSAYNTSTSSVERPARVLWRSGRRENFYTGLVCLALANSPEFVAPSAGASSVFGTNPLAAKRRSTQKAGAPFTFDMATSAVALFGVLTAKATGAPLAEGVAYDASGNVTTDAGAVLDGGAIATFGGHKGAGLALCVELLAGALSGRRRRRPGGQEGSQKLGPPLPVREAGRARRRLRREGRRRL